METEIRFEVEREVPGDEDWWGELIIRGDVDPGEPAKLSGHPDTWHPGDPGYSDILAVLIEIDGVERRWTGRLTSYEKECIQEQLQEQLKQDAEDNFDPPDDYDDYGPDSGWMDYIN